MQGGETEIEEEEFTWTSNKKNVADVNADGKVTALSPGTATITATAADGTGKKATVTVYVSTQVTTVNVNAPSSKIGAGTSMSLTASVAPESATIKAVEWSLGEIKYPYGMPDSLAMVKNPVSIGARNGKLTVHKDVPAGTQITVKATATDWSGKASSCAITVCPAVTGVVLMKGDEEVPKGLTDLDVSSPDPTFSLTAKCSPEGSLQDVSWKSSNEAIASVSDGVVTLHKAGTCNITATSLDGSNKSASVKLTITQSGVVLTGPSEVAAGKNITLTATGPKVSWKIDSIDYANGFDPESANVKNPITVSNGKVTVNAKVPVGTAFTVKAESTADNSKYADQRITVTEKTANSVAISYKETDYTGKKLGIDRSIFEDSSQMIELTSRVIDNKENTDNLSQNVTWTTGNAKVATIDSVGDNKVTVKIIAAGTAVIKATAADGSGKSGSVTLNVANLASTLTIKSANNNSETDNIYAGKTLQFAVDTIYPARTADKKVTWSAEPAYPDGFDAATTFVKIKTPVSITAAGRLTVNAAVPANTKITVKATTADGGYVDSNEITVTVKKLAGRVDIYEIDDTVSANNLSGKKLGIDRDTVNAETGNTKTLRAVLYDGTTASASMKGVGQDVTWTSSDAQIAEVTANTDEGTATVTAHKAGTAVITAIAGDGSKKSARVTINVASLVSGITITGADTIQPGKSVTYTASVTPARAADKSLTWTVAVNTDSLTDEAKSAYGRLKNPITISNGKLTVNKSVPAGVKIAITAESKDGSYVKGEKTVEVAAQ